MESELAREFGGIYCTIPPPGGMAKLVVWVSDPDMVEQIMTDKARCGALSAVRKLRSLTGANCRQLPDPRPDRLLLHRRARPAGPPHR
jgi:hypothetical protein